MIWPTQWRTKARDPRPSISSWGWCNDGPQYPAEPWIFHVQRLTLEEMREKYIDYRDMRGPSPSQVWHDEIQQFYIEEDGNGD